MAAARPKSVQDLLAKQFETVPSRLHFRNGHGDLHDRDEKGNGYGHGDGAGKGPGGGAILPSCNGIHIPKRRETLDICLNPPQRRVLQYGV